MRHIDADALKKRIEEARQCFGPGGALSDTNYFKAIAFELFGVLLGYIDEAQTLDAEPVRHGHWIIDMDENSIQCSVCHEWVSYDGSGVHVEDVDIYNDLEAHYCNYCGAKMDEEEL